ncbi:hypothetical protein G6O67_002869 [Ophiocordyceps sinensis]|uniref:DUF7918 domain-containing protein n=2 Tax=Ophiocordyceps sinensis TaxID=72228 RepID=A0A8H4PV77_9HYPO|nr:hypothetical protein OCS_02966 [Ophiocordyceps sinensis CO18]KAF4511032.1 hypothetical protein G6O67_002869 [Ophiocordyceps sinensis]
MAVLQMWPGLIVRVKVAGQPATEYDPPEDDENDPEDSTGQPASTKCYIESTSGLRYSVEAEITSEFKLSAPYQVVVLSVTIDGKFADGRYRFVVGENVVRPVTIEVDRIVEPAPAHVPGLGAQRFFTFAPVSAIEDANKSRVMRDAQTANSLGTILAKVFIGYGEVPVKRTKRAKAHDTDAFQLAEKAMKGRELTHGTKFSDGSMGPVPKVNDLTFQRVIGQFSFMYRSRSALQKEMVLPPSPTPTDGGDRLENMGEEELRKLARDLLRTKKPNALPASLSSIKRDPDEDDEIIQARKLKRVKTCEDEVIDLTSD